MLRAFTDLKNMSLVALDGEIGTLEDAYFDDHLWTLRYFVVSTGTWFSRQRVLVSPHAVSGADWEAKSMRLYLTREKVRNAPPADADKPISRQFESDYFRYYGYPTYWTGPLAWGAIAWPGLIHRPSHMTSPQRPVRQRETVGDPHLRSTNEVIGYHVHATDGSIGHVEDVLLNDWTWSLRFFVLDTRNWLPGPKVLATTDQIVDVSWEDESIDVAMTRDEVRSSPSFDPDALSSEAEQSRLSHYQAMRL